MREFAFILLGLLVIFTAVIIAAVLRSEKRRRSTEPEETPRSNPADD